MVVKVSSSQKNAQRVLRKYGLCSSSNSSGGGNNNNSLSSAGKKAHNNSFESYWRLKRIVPTISEKENISKLDVVLEAINYIQTLQCNLKAAGGLIERVAVMQHHQQQQPQPQP